MDPTVIKNAVNVLKSVNLDRYAHQEPMSNIDDERFAYFYKDPLTHTYNHYYLDFILENNKDRKKDLCLNALYIKNLSSYNKEYGCSEGNKILKNFSDYLRSEFPDSQIFHIFGNAFILLHNIHYEININKINNLPLLKRHNLYCEHFLLTINWIYTICLCCFT